MAYDPYSGMPTKKKNPYGSLPPLGYPGVSRTSTGAYTGNFAGGLSPVPQPEQYVSMPGMTTPDYQALLESSLKPLRDQLAQQQSIDSSALTSARQRAIAQFGVVPDFAGMDQAFLSALNASGAAPDIAGSVTDQVRSLAAQNTAEGLSTTALIGRANEKAVADIRNALASRGMLQSGELGYQFGEQQQAFKQANADATSKLNDYLAGVAKAYADSERTRASQLLTGEQTAAESVAKRAAAVPLFQGTYVANAPDGNGKLYRGTDGVVWRVDDAGNRYPYDGPDPSPVDSSPAPVATAPVVRSPAPTVMPASVAQTLARALTPGSSASPRYYSYPSQVPVGPGQKVKYADGRGYYAG